jgi:hypothetical protein
MRVEHKIVAASIDAGVTASEERKLETDARADTYMMR